MSDLSREEIESEECEHCREYHVHPNDTWQQVDGEVCPLCNEYTIQEVS